MGTTPLDMRQGKPSACFSVAKTWRPRRLNDKDELLVKAIKTYKTSKKSKTCDSPRISYTIRLAHQRLSLMAS